MCVIEIDRDAKAAYIRLTTEPVARTIEIAEGVNADLNDSGKIVGIEILGLTLPDSGYRGLSMPIASIDA